MEGLLDNKLVQVPQQADFFFLVGKSLIRGYIWLLVYFPKLSSDLLACYCWDKSPGYLPVYYYCLSYLSYLKDITVTVLKILTKVTQFSLSSDFCLSSFHSECCLVCTLVYWCDRHCWVVLLTSSATW